MEFEGTFEDLSIVDVLQLLHVTRNEGVLFVKGAPGEIRLALKDGFVVAAVLPDQSATMGHTLVEMGAISPERLAQVQGQAKGDDPIEAALHVAKVLRESGDIDPATSWQAQEKMVEATFAEMLSWDRGAFKFDVGPVTCLDDFRQVSSSMGLDLSGLDIQRALLAAMKGLNREFGSGPPAPLTGPPERDRPTRPGVLDAWAQVSAGERGYDSFVPTAIEDTTVDAIDELGIDGSDRRPSSTLDLRPSRPPASRPRLSSIPAIHVGRTRRSQPPLTSESRWPEASGKEAVIPPPPADAASERSILEPKRVVLFVPRGWLKDALTEWCSQRHIELRIAENELEVYQHVQEGEVSGVSPVLLVDLAQNADDGVWAERSKSVILRLRRLRPDLQVAALCDTALAAQSDAYEFGVSYPLPCSGNEGSPKERRPFLNLVQSCLEGIFLQRREVSRDVEQTRRQVALLKQRLSEVRITGGVPEISLVLLRYLAEFLERCVVFAVRQDQLHGVGAFGLQLGETLAHSMANLNIPLVMDSEVRRLVREGTVFVGDCNDSTVLNPLYELIGPPNAREVVLLPLRAEGNTIGLIYGDYGTGIASPLWTEPLEILMHQAGLALEVALLRQGSEPAASPSSDEPDREGADFPQLSK